MTPWRRLCWSLSSRRKPLASFLCPPSCASTALWVLAVACAVYLGPEAARSWKRLEGGPIKTGALYLTGVFGITWGGALNLALIMG